MFRLVKVGLRSFMSGLENGRAGAVARINTIVGGLSMSIKSAARNISSGATPNTSMNIKKQVTRVSSVEVERSSIIRQSVVGVQKTTERRTSSDDEKTLDTCQRIRDSILKDRISVASSPFDTAWVAMVPSPDSLENPCFPECLKWILENQKSDGSWDSSSGSKTFVVMKEVLSSTLACIIALKKWNVNGHKHIEKGLQFIVCNFQFALDEKEYSPLGFNIIFPSMLETARELGLELLTKQEDLDVMFQLRNLELKRGSEINSNGWKAYIACIAEGIHVNNHHPIMEWDEVMKYQLNNGSLFNSPSATAAVLIHHPDANGLLYLQSVLQNFGNAVPTAYPFEVSTKVSIIDSLQKLGIDRHFKDIIENFFDEIYRLWVENDEEMYSDMTTCAMAFRLLRMHGYDISSAVFEELDEDRLYCTTTDGNLNNLKTILELYNASHIKLSEDEMVLNKLNFWTRNLLELRLVSQPEPKSEIERIFFQEVDHALKFPSYANLERNEHKRNIENFAVQNIISTKKSFLLPITITDDMLRLAFDDFNTCQSVYQKELAVFESWFKDKRLDQVTSLQERMIICYWSSASTNFPPEMSDARICTAKNSMLVTAVDVLFDVSGSKEELENFVRLVERWDEDYTKDHCVSEQVYIIFFALYDTINELGAKASALHDRDVTSHLIEIWLEVINSMMIEEKWRMEALVPTLDQYMNNACVTFSMGPIVLSSLYFVGPKLHLEIIRSQESRDLLRLVSACCRLLNDLHSVEREAEEGKLNWVSLRVLLGNGKISMEDAKCEIRSLIESNRSELLRLVVTSDETSFVPRACKDLFWMMGRINHLVYARNDGFTSPKEMWGFIKDVLFEPLNLVYPIHE